ncbi:DNA adenine methylase [Pseudogracilibacillus sp. ICA-222130]|uniref:DNA adenine methylase n=1 Tax=Pseudogracilibacillus sp. ICA-222130 TaxID=3134655 RepID=UPI0030C0FF05
MARNNSTLIKPFVKWVGGKRQLLDDIYEYMPDDGYSTYYEPFLGGGALFLSEQPKKAIVNDGNEELINTYKVIQRNVSELIEALKVHKEKNNEDHFYEVREWDRKPGYEERSDVEKAARLIY